MIDRRPSIVALTIVLILTVAPVAVLFIHGIQIFDWEPEFVSYRIGNALRIISDNAEDVHPVQGLPTALLSKLIVQGMIWTHDQTFYTDPLLLQLYSELLFAALFGALSVTLAYLWCLLTNAERIAIAGFLLIPWYIGGPAINMMFAPDYWIGEYVFLAISLAFLFALSRHGDVAARLPIVIGMWLGIGAATKISLVGIAPFFVLAVPPQRRNIVWMASGAAACFLLVTLLYAGMDFRLAGSMLGFQIAFFLHPNVSAMYSGPEEIFRSNIVLTCLLCVMLATVALSVRGWRDCLIALTAITWAAINGYVLWKRPHDSSMTDAALAALFIVALLGARHVWTISVAIIPVVLVSAFSGSGFNQTKIWKSRIFDVKHLPDDSAVLAAINHAPAVWFVNDNYWNAGLPIQAFAINGGLADPSTQGPQDFPRDKMMAAFGDISVVFAHQKANLTRALDLGIPIYWLRIEPFDDNSREAVAAGLTTITAAVKVSGATMSEKRVFHRGSWRILGEARPQGQ